MAQLDKATSNEWLEQTTKLMKSWNDRPLKTGCEGVLLPLAAGGPIGVIDLISRQRRAVFVQRAQHQL